MSDWDWMIVDEILGRPFPFGWFDETYPASHEDRSLQEESDEDLKNGIIKPMGDRKISNDSTPI